MSTLWSRRQHPHRAPGIAAITIAKFVDVKAVWTVDCQGRVDVKLHGQRDMEFPFLPRFGIRMFLPKAFGEVEYFAHGPYESYIDKHRASRLGVYAQTVDSMHEDYIKPQENSSHAAAGMSLSPTALCADRRLGDALLLQRLPLHPGGAGL